MAKGDVLVRMKADVSNYDANIARARGTLERFKQENLTLGGVLNQSTKSIVAAAAQYASFAAVIGTVASGFAEATSKGIAMSREAEGVKAAFDRLNQPGLLDNLREATHGTVNDLELMKQAVKFDNFNLSLEQMGTFLAFAQQQAKDTGQDVNYLVDSIVTGLGRKSLPILDNLGLSAEEIRNRMKETGDMTKAVADIIKDRMEAAGGYVETASDRAAQAQVRLDNAMKDLGDTMNSLTGEGASLWTELKIGAIDLANTAIKPLIRLFNQLASYIKGTSVEDILTSGMDDVTDTVDDNGRLIRKNAINSIPGITVTGNAPKKKPVRGSGRNPKDAEKELEEKLRASFEKTILKSNLAGVKAVESNGPSEIWQAITQGADESTDAIQRLTDAFEALNAKEGVTASGLKGDAKTTADAWRGAAAAMSSVGSALSQMEDPSARIMGIIGEAIANIAAGFATASAKEGKGGIWYWIAATAAGLATMISTISAIHSATGFAQGGMVQGNTYSGDQVPIRANAGEVVLTRAMQGNLASQLEGNGLGNLNLSATISGEQIRLALNNNGRRTGRGEYVQTNFR